MSAWIKMIPVDEATGVVKEMYDQVKTPHGTVDNVMRAHSLRPHTMAGHWTNARRLLKNKTRSEAIRAALDAGKPEHFFQGKELALLNYARKLTADVAHMNEGDIAALRAAGCNDGEILEVNQVCAYFNYSNRLLNGLGVTTEGDVIGYYSEDDDKGARR
jgi:hypothetical protein